MPTVPLPDDPDLGQLRKQARDLQTGVRADWKGSLDLVAEHHPDGAPADPGRWPLHAAQLVLARLYGFPGWPALVRHVGIVTEHRRVPDTAPVSADPATEFLRRACLTFGDADGPLQATAAAVLAEHPGIARDDVWVAAARADVEEVARLLAVDPALAVRDGGPHRWHLELLLAAGLGRGDGGPWRRRLGAALDGPAELLRHQLSWAVTHDLTGRVALLAEHGVDLRAPLPGRYGVPRRPPYVVALTSGRFAVADLLERLGAATTPEPEERVLAAVLAADRDGVTALGADALARARAARPGLVVWAAVAAAPDAVRLAVELGWDVSAAPAPTSRPSRRGRPRCTTPRARGTRAWSGCCWTSAPTGMCATGASTPPRRAGRSTGDTRAAQRPRTRSSSAVSVAAAGVGSPIPRPCRTSGSRGLIRTSAPVTAEASSASRRTVGISVPAPISTTAMSERCSRSQARCAAIWNPERAGSHSTSPNIRMLGRASAPQDGQRGSGDVARIVASSTVTVTRSAGQTGYPQSVVHCRWWMDPWHSAMPSRPARWNCPSTLDVKTRVGRSPAQRTSTAKPVCGTVAR